VPAVARPVGQAGYMALITGPHGRQERKGGDRVAPRASIDINASVCGQLVVYRCRCARCWRRQMAMLPGAG
jgi:hypothetical protein